MHFPDDEAKRRAFIGKLWSGFYTDLRNSGGGTTADAIRSPFNNGGSSIGSRRARRNQGSMVQGNGLWRPVEGAVRDSSD